MNSKPVSLSGVILAGGKGTRMGHKDKSQIQLQGRTLLDWSLDIAREIDGPIMLNTNQPDICPTSKNLTLLSDPWPDFRGPLAGIYAAMQQSTSDYLAVLPVDAPLVPKTLFNDLLNHLLQNKLDIVFAETPEQPHFLHAIIATSLKDELFRYLDQGQRAVGRFYKSHRYGSLAFRNTAAFLNINTPEDLTAANAFLSNG